MKRVLCAVDLSDLSVERHPGEIVLGNHGRGGATLPFLGSTIEQIVRAAPCPVLTIQSPHERLSHDKHP